MTEELVTYQILDLLTVYNSGQDCVEWIRSLVTHSTASGSHEVVENPCQVILVITRTEIEAIYNVAPEQAVGMASLISEFADDIKVVETEPGEDRLQALTRVFESLKERGRTVEFLPDVPPQLGTNRFSDFVLSISAFEDPVGDPPMTKPNISAKQRVWNPGSLFGNRKYAGKLRLLIDTSALMCPGMTKLCEKDLIPWGTNALSEGDAAVIAAPREVMRELETMARRTSPDDNPSRQQNAIAGITLLSRLNQLGILKLVSIGHASANQAADDVFGPLILQLLLEYDVLLLTQDRNLGALCNQQHAVQTASAAYTGRKRRFAACRIRGDRLSLHDDSPPRPPEDSPPARPDARKTPEPAKIRTLDQKSLTASPLPKADGDEVVTEDGDQLRIRHSGMAGGEGTVYPIDGRQDEVAKIYHAEHLKQWRFDKLSRMVANPVRNRAVAWPTSVISNKNKQPVGFLMPRVHNAVPLGDSVFSLGLLQDQFPAWQRRHLVILARNLATVVGILHDRNEVIGDLNPANILVHEENDQPRIRLVDCDSWQFDGYPSPVGMPEYTHPDLKGKNFNTFLRSQEHDLYALAILIFQILFIGRHPFSTKGDQSLAVAMQERAFPYPLGSGDDDREKTPKGVAWRIWTQLPWGVQKAFHEVFARGHIVTAAEWSEKLHSYNYDIVNGKLDALKNADAICPTAVRVPVGRAGDVSEELKCQESGCTNTEIYYGADVIARKKNMRFFRCRGCVDTNRLRNQQGKSRLCQKCGTVFSHPIWFEEMLQDTGVPITDLCDHHGGVRSEFHCADCKRTWIERSPDRWKWIHEQPNAYCYDCFGKRRDKGTEFHCAECGSAFHAHGNMANMLLDKPARYVLCFSCLNGTPPTSAKSAPAPATRTYVPPVKPQQQSPPAKPKTQTTASTPKKASLLGWIWDTLTGQ